MATTRSLSKSPSICWDPTNVRARPSRVWTQHGHRSTYFDDTYKTAPPVSKTHRDRAFFSSLKTLNRPGGSWESGTLFSLIEFHTPEDSKDRLSSRVDSGLIEIRWQLFDERGSGNTRRHSPNPSEFSHRILSNTLSWSTEMIFAG
ncbi:hypothetical protein HYFRA_00008677 [Hymenoscyphus fraxineus]|uniref:Uncharacterized protein n=1 Tax=Hymenoscyphus fraxineus TaxID=746836 RepID=A0A9N9L0U3_9HELO|nr:hypothetical protein HYFRA_00008677 [Hymenoscyphus fraxineus]